MQSGMVASALAHVAIISWGMVSFSAPAPFETISVEAMPIELVPVSELTDLRLGEKSAPVAEIAALHARPDPAPVTAQENLSEPQIKIPDSVEPVLPQVKIPEPIAEPVPVLPKPETVEAQSAPIAALTNVLPRFKPKSLSQKKKRVSTPKVAKKPPKKQQKRAAFDPSQIAALLDKRSEKPVVSGDLNAQSSTFGVHSGSRVAAMTQSELNVLSAQIGACWNTPAGATNADDLKVRVRMFLNEDGSLNGFPEVLSQPAGPFGNLAAESAVRAIRRCQPFSLPVEKYASWQEVNMNFDPRDMF